MRGGFLDNLIANTKNTLSNWGSTLSNDASTIWDKTKKASSSAYSSVTGTNTNNSTSSYTPQTYNNNSTIGGKRKTRHKRIRKRGGFSTSLNDVATNAATFSGNETAQPHNWVGGKRKSKRKHNKKSRKTHSRHH
jgi:hypothetical protein